MGQSSLGFNADEDYEDEQPGANALPASAQDRASGSLQSPNFQLAAASNLVGDAARSADATRTDASAGGETSSDAPSNPSQDPPAAQAAPSQLAQSAPTPVPAQTAFTTREQSGASTDGGDALAQPAASDAASAPRQPIKQIGQIPDIDNAQILRQANDLPTAWQQMAQQSQARRQQIAQINQSDPYVSDDDGRWKKQMVDPLTGAINEHDIVDVGMGKIDPRTGNIFAPTSQGPQLIGVDPQQKILAQFVDQKTQAQAQGSQIAANIAAAQSALLDTQQQLQTFQGIPERMNGQIGKYTQAALDPNNTAAVDQLQKAQQEFSAWKAQNPRYTELITKRDALTNQIQQQQAAKAANEAQIAQLLTTQGYVQWNGNLPPSQASQAGAANPANQAPAANPSTPGGPASSSDITIRDADTRAGVIAAQTGFPAGLAYVSALHEAKQQGAQTVDGSAIDDAIKAIQPVAQAQLMKLTPPQLRQAFQSGLITRQQMQATVIAQQAAQDQAAATADNGVSKPVDLAARAFAENDRFLYRSSEYLSRLISGDSAATNWLKQYADSAEALGQGKWGSVNPAFNNDTASKFAEGIGDSFALAPASLATALGIGAAIPEGGALAGVVAASRLARLGLYAANALPAAFQFGAAGGAKKYDDTLAATGDQQKATDAATAGAWQAIKSAWPYLLVGGGIGMAEKALLPAVMNPLARAGVHLVANAAGNMVASGIDRAADGGHFTDFGQSLGQDLAFAFTSAGHTALEQTHTNAQAATAQNILAGTDPSHQAMVAAANDPHVDPAARQKAAEVAAQMKAGAAQFLQDKKIPPIAPGQKADPAAQSVVDLTARAGNLRNKIQTAFDTGGADGLKDLGAHREALNSAESDLHAATQELVNRVPAAMQTRIAKAAAPDVDWDNARQQNAQDPMAHFATENLGAALRDRDIPPDRQQAIRALATAHGVHPDLADHIANQAVGAKAVKDLTSVLRRGKIGQGRAETLKAMGFLQPSDPGDPTAPLHVTEDAQRLLPPGAQKFVQLKPDVARYNHSPDPAHGSVLYQNAVAGMERFSKTAEQMLPRRASAEETKAALGSAREAAQPAPQTAQPIAAKPVIQDPAAIAAQDGKIVDPHAAAGDAPRSAAPAPSAAEKMRDEIGSKLAGRYPQLLESRLAGHTPEEMAARFGVTPENAAHASQRVAAHVGRMMRERGVSAEDVEKALAPKPPQSRASGPSAAEKIRDEIGSKLAGRYPQLLESRLAGHTPEEMAARFGVTPENAAHASQRVAAHVGRMMRERGVSAEDAEKALAPKTQPSARSAPAAEPTGEDRNAIVTQAAQLRQQYAVASEADKPSLQEQYRTLRARANIVDAVNETDRNAKGQAFQGATPGLMEAARQQVRDFASKFGRVFAGVDAQTEADGTGGVSYNKAANRLQVSWNEIHNSAGTAYSNALRAGATVEQARDAATAKIRAILDEELRHVADVRANGDAATKALWESLPPEIQDATRRVYSRDNPTADVAMKTGTQLGYEYKRVLSQNEQTGEVSELAEVTKAEAEKTPHSGDDGWVRQVMRSLQRMGNWLRGNGGGETARQLNALHAELAKITASEGAVTKDTAHGGEPIAAHGGVPESETDPAETLASSPSASDHSGAKHTENEKIEKLSQRNASNPPRPRTSDLELPAKPHSEPVPKTDPAQLSTRTSKPTPDSEPAPEHDGAKTTKEKADAKTGKLAERTPEENKKARNKFKNNKNTAIKLYEKKTGRVWPKDQYGNNWPAHHPTQLKLGGDPMEVVPQDPGGPDPHNVLGPDGKTDYQRWGAQGPAARAAKKNTKGR